MRQRPEINNVEERFVIAHGFRDFPPRSLGPATLGPVARQYLMVGAHDGGNCSPHLAASQKREKEEGPGSQCPLPGNTPSDLTAFHKAHPKSSTTSQ